MSSYLHFPLTLLPLFILALPLTATSATSLSPLSLSPSAHVFRRPCHYRCRFTFCTGTTRLLLTTPNMGMLPRICLPGSYLGRVLRTGEARVSRSGMAKPYRISKWRPHGLHPPFHRDAVFAKEIHGMNASGVARAKARGNQHMFLEGVCVVLPIREWEQMDENKNVVAQRRGGKGDCIAFRSMAARVVVELRWYSGDDLDLSVLEPDGDRLSTWRRSSESGMLWGDGGVDMCGVANVSGEKAVWQVADLVQGGTYRAKVKIAGLCAEGGAKWTIGISVAGRMLKKVSGTISGEVGGVIPGSVFDFTI